MTTYGRRGGQGPTRDRKIETIEAEFCGSTYRRRVFFGQRWMALAMNEHGDFCVSAWPSEGEANHHLESRISGEEWPVQLVAEARLVRS